MQKEWDVLIKLDILDWSSYVLFGSEGTRQFDSWLQEKFDSMQSKYLDHTSSVIGWELNFNGQVENGSIQVRQAKLSAGWYTVTIFSVESWRNLRISSNYYLYLMIHSSIVLGNLNMDINKRESTVSDQGGSFNLLTVFWDNSNTN